jgi:hypothetical protein
MPATTKWLPSAYQDEWIPPPRETPDAWIVQHDGKPALAPCDDTADQPVHQSLAETDIVEFDCMTDYGDADLTLRESGTWSVTRDKPDGAEHVTAMNGWQSETLASSVEECARMLRDAGADPADYRITYYTWSGPILFQFADGKFIRLGRQQ